MAARGRKAHKPKLGTGKRFAALKKNLAKKGARNPGGLAAFIGRKKFGKKRFAALGAAGRRRKARK
ncbi:hypothetical protein LCGC14_2298950 [marine sediment metagenome]|uniref:Uncharacterized protein n=1 Tax=marine sediment metagenome TaxID=412755 RepID=A0A0F9FJ06_9ZZZZ